MLWFLSPQQQGGWQGTWTWAWLLEGQPLLSFLHGGPRFQEFPRSGITRSRPSFGFFCSKSLFWDWSVHIIPGVGGSFPRRTSRGLVNQPTG